MTGELDLAKPHRIRGFEGSLGEWFQQLEWLYTEMVGAGGVRLWGGRVLDGGYASAADGRTGTFWHLCTTSTRLGTEASRVLSIHRASDIGRVHDVLERLAVGDPRAIWWWEERRGPRKLFLHVAPIDSSVHIVLRQAGRDFRLTTAYPVRKRNAQQYLMRKAADSWESGIPRRRDDRHVDWRRPLAGPHRWPRVRHAVAAG